VTLDAFLLCPSSGSVFDNELGKTLAKFAPQVDPTPIRLSVAAIYKVPPEFRASVIHAYAKAVRSSLFFGFKFESSADEFLFLQCAVGLCLHHWRRHCHSRFFICLTHRVSSLWRLKCLSFLHFADVLVRVFRNHNIVKMDKARQARVAAKARAEASAEGTIIGTADIEKETV
jgi:hypothetical protein